MTNPEPSVSDMLTQAMASADQWMALLNELTQKIIQHRPECAYPPPLCPGSDIWKYVENSDRGQLEYLLVVALQDRATREMDHGGR